MLSLDYIRENKQKVVVAAKNKNREVDVDGILELDGKRKILLQAIQKLREERNVISKEKNHERGKKLKEELKTLETEGTEIEKKLEKLLSVLPNVPLDEVPVGKDSSFNKEIKTWGTKPGFTFTPKSHEQLGKDLDILDLERGSKVSGFRGYFLKKELAQLHFGILMFAFQNLVKKGYSPITSPSVVKGFTLFGSAQFPWGEKEVYSLNDQDAYLAGTGEVAVTAFHAGEILEERNLPEKFVTLSPCYRKEAGSYGKDTKGLYRVHEFWKVEQIVIATNDLEKARKIHLELQQNSEELLQALEIPYRVLLMSTGDMGEPQILKYDTEAWMPSRNGYGETMSNSIMGDFQMRRLKTKYRTKDGKTQYCFSLNNTAIASPRILIPLLENHQQADGSVKIPEVLQPFVGFTQIRTKK